MPAVLEAVNRRPIYSLWSKTNTDNSWHHLDTGYNEAELRFKAESLRRLFTSQLFIVVSGTMQPKGSL